MKRAISLILSLVFIFSALTVLTACSGSSADVPEGMQLVRGGEDIGYYMYAPEEWIVANQEELGIACTYVSKVNPTSVTLVEASFTEAGINDYVAAELEKFPEELNMKVKLALKADSLGNATKAWKTAYTYDYNYTFGEEDRTITYQVMQIFAIYGSRSYILTYTASTGTYDGDVSYYDKFLEKAQEVIKNIKFTEIKPQASTEPVSYPKDTDGYSLVSDRSLAGFDLYIPDSYKLDFASSIVSATNASGCNINVSEATGNIGSAEDYWKNRFNTLEALGASVKLIDTDKESIAEAATVADIGGGLKAITLKYSFTLAGRTQLVYQAIVIRTFAVYVFTYTAEEAHFEANLPEAQTILNKIEF